MGDPLGWWHRHLLHGPGGHVVEQALAGAEDDRRDVQAQFVEQSRLVCAVALAVVPRAKAVAKH